MPNATNRVETAAEDREALLDALVEAVARAIYEQQRTDHPLGKLFWSLWGELPIAAREPFNAQARAAIAALRDTGTVEWGVRYCAGTEDEREEWSPAQSEAKASIADARRFIESGFCKAGEYEPMALVKRTVWPRRVGEWEVAE